MPLDAWMEHNRIFFDVHRISVETRFTVRVMKSALE